MVFNLKPGTNEVVLELDRLKGNEVVLSILRARTRNQKPLNQKMLTKIALIAAVILPLWNIPLIVRIIKRKSSEDISIYWALGIWICFVLIAPSGFISRDLVWGVFNITDFIFFSIVVVVVLAYRKKTVVRKVEHKS